MAEVREIIEKFRGGDRGIRELIAAMTLMQGQLDPNSFIAGMLSGKSSGGRGFDRSAALMMMMSAANSNNVQQQGTGVTTNPMQQLLPLLLLMGRDDWDGYPDKTIEIVDKKTSTR